MQKTSLSFLVSLHDLVLTGQEDEEPARRQLAVAPADLLEGFFHVVEMRPAGKVHRDGMLTALDLDHRGRRCEEDWFWVMSSTRRVADMMMSLRGLIEGSSSASSLLSLITRLRMPIRISVLTLRS